MFGLGMPELILILVISLVIFGPSKLPEMGASIGKATVNSEMPPMVVQKWR